MVLVTGLGRCGTSILMRCLKEIGFYIGANCVWDDKIRAGYELPVVANINFVMCRDYFRKGNPINLDDYVLNHSGKPFNWTYRQAIGMVDEKGFIKVIKDPRFTWYPDIVEAWWSVRQDFKLIICHRDIESVVKSRNMMPKEHSDLKNRGSLQYKEDFADFFTKVLQLEIPYETLFFPNFLRNFKSTYNVLEKVGLHFDYDLGKKVWDCLIDRELLKET